MSKQNRKEREIPPAGQVGSEKTASAGTLAVRGALALTLATFSVKVFGLVFKLALGAKIGDEGMGYFNSGYTVYTWFYLLSCAGIPTAVSVLVAREETENGSGAGRRVFSALSRLFLSVGFVVAVLLAILSSVLSNLLGNRYCADSILAVSPAIFFSCLSGGLRGYFQGRKNMTPSAVSQVIEGLGKVVFGLSLAFWGLSRGFDAPTVSALAICGVSLGTLLGTLFLIGAYARGINEGARSMQSTDRSLYGRFLKIAVPITLTSTVLSLTSLLDLGMVMNRLVAGGISEREANILYGNYTTLAVPFFNLPTVFVYPIAATAVPFLSAAFAEGKNDRVRAIIQTSIRVTLLLALPCSLGLGLMGRRILTLFFDAERVAVGAPLLSALAPAVVFLSVLTVMNAVLQAEGKAGATVVSMLIGAVAKIAVGYVLLGNPKVGIAGAAVGTVLCYLVAMLADLVFLRKRVYKGRDQKIAVGEPSMPGFARVFLPSLVLAPFLWIVSHAGLVPEGMGWTVLTVIVAVAVYGASVLGFGALNGEETEWLAGKLPRLPFSRFYKKRGRDMVNMHK